jgi:FkbM family methyltransferase
MANIIDIESYGHRFKAVDPSCYNYSKLEFQDEIKNKSQYWNDLAPGEVVMDIGAAFGAYTLPALSMGATVIAVEPSSHAGQFLAQAVEANGWSDRFTLCRTILWQDDLPMPDWYRQVGIQQYGLTADVPITTLDKLVDGLAPSRLDRIKCDTEGAERVIFANGTRALLRFRPSLLIETHNWTHLDDFYSGVGETVRNTLSDLGYKVETLPMVDGWVFTIATYPSG